MISAELVAILRCPQTGQTLALASAEVLAQANAQLAQTPGTKEGLRSDGETSMHETVDAGLVRADHKMLYPILNDIPLLLAEKGIAL